MGVGTDNVHICCCYHSRVHEQATLRLHLQLYLFMQCISRPNTSTTMTREQKREEQREDKDNLYNTSPLNNKLLTIIILLTTFLLGTQPADVIGFSHAIHCRLRPPVHVCQSAWAIRQGHTITQGTRMADRGRLPTSTCLFPPALPRLAPPSFPASRHLAPPRPTSSCPAPSHPASPQPASPRLPRLAPHRPASPRPQPALPRLNPPRSTSLHLG